MDVLNSPLIICKEKKKTNLSKKGIISPMNGNGNALGRKNQSGTFIIADKYDGILI